MVREFISQLIPVTLRKQSQLVLSDEAFGVRLPGLQSLPTNSLLLDLEQASLTFLCFCFLLYNEDNNRTCFIVLLWVMYINMQV